MKKFIIAAAFIILFTAGTRIEAQTIIPDGKESEYYYVNITLERVFPYRAGYIVQYRRGLRGLSRAYLPVEWFTHTAARGEILSLPRGNTWPSMTVFYRDGEFSHVRLYVHRWPAHPSWGNVPQTVNLDSNFEDITDIRIHYK